MRHYLDQILTHEHKEIGVALWSYMWLVQRITDDSPDGGLVAGGQPVKLEDIARDIGLEVKAIQRQIALLKAGRYIRARKCSHGIIYVVERLQSIPNPSGSSQKDAPNSQTQQLHDVVKLGYHNITTSQQDDITPPPAQGSPPDGLSLPPVPPISSPLPSSPSSPIPTKQGEAAPLEQAEEGLGPQSAWKIAIGIAGKNQAAKVVEAMNACEPVSLVDGLLTVRLPANRLQALTVDGAIIRQRLINALLIDKKNPIELKLIRPGSETEARAGP